MCDEYTFTDLICDTDPAWFDNKEDYLEEVRKGAKLEMHRSLTVEEEAQALGQYVEFYRIHS